MLIPVMQILQCKALQTGASHLQGHPAGTLHTSCFVLAHEASIMLHGVLGQLVAAHPEARKRCMQRMERAFEVT